MPRVSSRLIVISAFVFACSAESTAPPPADGGTLDVADPPVCVSPRRFGDTCAGFTRGFVGLCNPDRAVSNPMDPRDQLCECRTPMPWGCEYARGSSPGAEPATILCGANVIHSPLQLVIRFREPFSALNVGRVLVMGQDFTVTEVTDVWLMPNGLFRFTRSTGPVLGALTISVVGPPMYVGTNKTNPTIPQFRIVGELCASRLNARLNVATAQVSPNI